MAAFKRLRPTQAIGIGYLCLVFVLGVGMVLLWQSSAKSRRVYDAQAKLLVSDFAEMMRTSRVSVVSSSPIPRSRDLLASRVPRGGDSETNAVVSHPGTPLLDGSRRVLGIVRPHPSTPNFLKVILDDWSVAFIRIPGIPPCITNTPPSWHADDDGPSNLPHREYFQPL